MKYSTWTIALAAAGVVSIGSVLQAEEAPNQVLTALSSTTLSGYVSSSAIWKFGTGNASMPGRSYDAFKQDGFNLDVVKLTLEKPLDEGQWSAGYKVDMLFGPDASLYNPAVGSLTGILNGSQDFALRQAYVIMRAPVGNGLDIKMGTFDTVIGYESFDYPNNPNYSRSYGYFIEPLSHTGVLASYTVADWLSLAAGVANTWSTGINARPARAAGFGPADESEKTYMGLITLTAPESFGFLKGSVLTAGIVDGLAGDASDRTSYYAGLTVPTPIEGLAVGAAYDYVGTKEVGNPAAVNGAASGYANATALYLSYQATEKLKLSTRGEYASGTAGSFGGKPVGNPNNEQYFGWTTTADYSLWANVITRAEFRWDHDASGGPKSFGNNDEKNALSLALNVIYKF